MKDHRLQSPSPKILQHPLMGVNLKNLVKLLSQQGAIPLQKWAFVGAFAASALLRAPFSMIDRWKARRSGAAEKVVSPIFIVGYWRSGTTHLHNLLAQSPDVGIITPLGSGLPDELLTLATWLKPILEKGLPEDRGVDNVAVTPRSPQEDEIPLANLQLLSVFHALYFPAHFAKNFKQGVFFDGASKADIDHWRTKIRYFLGKVALHQQKQPLLIKNPVYTYRIKLLLDIWPDARFIHIYRNPYRVYRSTMQYYPKMINELGLQSYKEADIEPVVLASYPRMLKKMYHDVRRLPDKQFAEIQYEELEQKPLEVLKKVYHRLALPGWPRAKIQTEAYLKSIADYRKNDYRYSPTDFEKVEHHWKEFVQRWGYKRPKLDLN